MKLNTIRELKGKIILKTGLHIGAGNDDLHIGGTDSSVVRDARTNLPYIPGSSLKGKIRSLLELHTGLMGITGGQPISLKTLSEISDEALLSSAEQILKLFGSSAADSAENTKFGPTRVSFSDAPLSEESINMTRAELLAPTEVKSENSINRIQGRATNPRQIERVIAGMSFNLSITLKQFDDEDLLKTLFTGCKLLELDYLGGNGSRGYGRVEISFDGDLQKQYESVSF